MLSIFNKNFIPPKKKKERKKEKKKRKTNYYTNIGTDAIFVRNVFFFFFFSFRELFTSNLNRSKVRYSLWKRKKKKKIENLIFENKSKLRTYGIPLKILKINTDVTIVS